MIDSIERSSLVHVHKFGGTSMADVSAITQVLSIIRSSDAPQCVVVSAMQGVTDALCSLVDAALAKQSCDAQLQTLIEKHQNTWKTLAAQEGVNAKTLMTQFSADHASLKVMLDALASHGEKPDMVAKVQSQGEQWTAQMMAELLGDSWSFLNAADVLTVTHNQQGVAVDWANSEQCLADWQTTHQSTRCHVVPGFVARTMDGATTTLGRNGSDWTASIFAKLLDAKQLTIWTDVDGVMSADPRLVNEPVCLPAISYDEACELAYFGAKVLHPRTMLPVMQAGIPMRLRNTFNTKVQGTKIASQVALKELDAQGSMKHSHSPMKGLSVMNNMAVLELIGSGLLGVPGTAERLFAALAEANISITMISQGSSEHSICCVVKASQAAKAEAVVTEAFADALKSRNVTGVRVSNGMAVLAAVGDDMVGTPGVAAQLFSGLARARVNVIAIAQGGSERNISVVVREKDAIRGLRAVHSAFWLSPQTLSVGIIGPGNVGKALLNQLALASPRFDEEHQLVIRLRALANSKRMVLDDHRLVPMQAFEQLPEGAPMDLDAFTNHVCAEHLPHAMIIDCSGHPAVADRYADWLKRGIHIVTPSKHAGSGDWQRYQTIQQAMRRHSVNGGMFRYEATVGAGLPVIQTLRSLLDTGDELIGIQGIFSGTLAWLFNHFDGNKPFSALVREAHQLGYTEPDPRDDLSGTDVARKLVILAREAGRQLSLSDVSIDNLVPEHLRDLSRDDFMARLEEMDDTMNAKLADAKAKGSVLRYLGILDEDGQATVTLSTPEPGDATIHGRLTDNLIQFTTKRYANNPLVVQGPGAGPEVTAAGVFGDMLLVTQALGARL